MIGWWVWWLLGWVDCCEWCGLGLGFGFGFWGLGLRVWGLVVVGCWLVLSVFWVGLGGFLLVLFVVGVRLFFCCVWALFWFWELVMFGENLAFCWSRWVGIIYALLCWVGGCGCWVGVFGLVVLYFEVGWFGLRLGFV